MKMLKITNEFFPKEIPEMDQAVARRMHILVYKAELLQYYVDIDTEYFWNVYHYWLL